MPTPWRLIYPGADLAFGPAASGLPLSAAPEYGPTDLTVDDEDAARADGVNVGEDFRRGFTITFTLHAYAATQAEAKVLAGLFLRTWRGDGVRSAPGAVAELKSPDGRSVFGRPRRAVVDETLSRFGKYAITADFTTVDDRWYGEPDELTVPLALSQGGGFVFPLRFPLAARGYTTRANSFTVDGDQPTPWVVAEVRGAILNPFVEVPGAFRWSAATSLAYDEWLTIDARPGRRCVLRNGERIASLTRTSDSVDAGVLAPGAHSLILSGSSSTGSPTATLSWRAANSIS